MTLQQLSATRETLSQVHVVISVSVASVSARSDSFASFCRTGHYYTVKRNVDGSYDSVSDSAAVVRGVDLDSQRLQQQCVAPGVCSMECLWEPETFQPLYWQVVRLRVCPARLHRWCGSLPH